MKAIRALLALTAVFTLMAVSNTRAQEDLPPCIIINGVKCYVQYNECGQIISIDCPEGAFGQAQFALLDPCDPDGYTGLNPDEGPINALLQPTAIQVSLPDPTYGQITTTLDPTRRANNTTIVSTDEARAAGQAFPLDVKIRFYALAQVESEPDAVFVSQTELTFTNNNVNSVSPFRNETFTLLNDVNYYRQGDESQTTVFTLQAGTTNLTIGGEGDREDQLR